MTAVTLWRSWMSSSSATHDTLSRQPPWRGVASPHVLLMPTVLLALAVLFQAVDIRLTKRAFDVIINDTALSALVAITVAAIGALTSIVMRSRHRVAAALNGALWIATGVAMALIRYNVGAITDDRLPSRIPSRIPPMQRSSASPRGRHAARSWGRSASD